MLQRKPRNKKSAQCQSEGFLSLLYNRNLKRFIFISMHKKIIFWDLYAIYRNNFKYTSLVFIMVLDKNNEVVYLLCNRGSYYLNLVNKI